MSFHNMHFYACCNNLLYELYNLDQNKYFLSIVYLFNNKITYNKYIYRYICTRFLSCLYFLVLPNCSAWEATPSHNFHNVYCCNDAYLVIKLQPLVLMSWLSSINCLNHRPWNAKEIPCETVWMQYETSQILIRT